MDRSTAACSSCPSCDKPLEQILHLLLQQCDLRVLRDDHGLLRGGLGLELRNPALSRLIHRPVLIMLPKICRCPNSQVREKIGILLRLNGYSSRSAVPQIHGDGLASLRLG